MRRDDWVVGPRLRAEGPLSPNRDSLAEAGRVSIVRRLAGVRSSLGERQDSLADLLIMAEVRPTGRESNDDASRRFVNQRCHLDQPRPPSAGLALAERIVRTSPVVMRSAASTCERFGRNFLRRVFREWLLDNLPRVDQ